MWAILIALLPMILKLLEYLLSKQKSGKPLRDNEKRRINAILHATTQLRNVSVAMGCKPDGEEDRELTLAAQSSPDDD